MLGVIGEENCNKGWWLGLATRLFWFGKTVIIVYLASLLHGSCGSKFACEYSEHETKVLKLKQRYSGQ